MENLYFCPECELFYIRGYNDDKRSGYCTVSNRPTTMEKVKLDCSKMKAENHMNGAYVYLGYSNNRSLYLQNNGEVKNNAWNDDLFKHGRFENLKEAEEALERFKEKMYLGSKAAIDKKLGLGQFAQQKVSKLHLQLENETAPLVQPITARLVSDKSGGRIVLQVQTSETPEFIPIARLGVKNGKVVMYRERGVESEFINTDSEGRIQN